MSTSVVTVASPETTVTVSGDTVTVNSTTGTAVQNLVDLNDVEISTLVGNAMKVVAVNADEDAFELQAAGAGDMLKATYDPDDVGADVFDPANQKLNGMDEIGAALADGDEMLVYDASGTANKKSLLSRVWTYIKGKADLVYTTGPSSSTDNAVVRFDSTTGKLIQNSGVTVDDNDNVAGVATLAHDTSYTETESEPTGTTFWDSDNHCLTTVYEWGSKLQHGFELYKIGSDEGNNYIEGTAVSALGTTGGRIIFVPTDASSDSVNACKYVGLLTTEPDSGNRVATREGSVRGVDTTGATLSFGGAETWAEDDELWVDPVNNGYLTNVEPSFPAYKISVGTITVRNSESGEIELLRRVEKQIQLSDVGGLNPTTVGARDLTGLPNRTDTTLSVDGSGNFTIAPTGDSFVVWNNGTSYTKTSEGVQVTADNDETYIYYDAGVLTKSTTVWDIADGAAPVAIVFKTGSSYAPWDERHAHNRDRNWHEWAHRTIGARYQSGFAGVFDNTTFSVAAGTFYDEDIDHVVSGTHTACRLWYRNTGAGSMTFESNVTTPYKAIAGVLQYDLNGTITPVSSNRYSSQWVYASPDPNYPIYVVVGQAQSNTLAGARSQSAPALPGLATAEWKLLYQVIYRNAGTPPTYIEAIDYRQVSTGPATTATVASHTALTDRDAADSHPATAISVDTTNFDNNLSSADDTVQKALETLDEMTAGGGTSYPADGRLTLESGVPISTTDQSAKTTLYYTPYVGDQIAVYDGSSAWSNLTFTETSLSLAGLTADKNYDIFGYDNSGTFALESLVWSDDTTRATALTRQNGVLVKTGATTRRYLGTIRINSTGGQCEDTETQRFAWNMYNRVNRRLYLAEETSHTYSTGTWRDWNNSELAVEIVSGFDTVAICSLSPQFNGTAVGVHYGSISGSTNLISQLAGVNYTGFRSSVSHNYVLPTGYSKLLIGENLSGLSSRVFFDANQRI